MTLKLLWEEYKNKFPDNHCQYTQFREYYHCWAKARFLQQGGEVMEVGYAELILLLINLEAGEVKQGPIIIAALPAINYIHTEAQLSQEKCHRINGHVCAFAFFGGETKNLRPDNLRTGIKSLHYYEPDLNTT